ncbi:MAG: trypsin-like peptidase domain-containing protein [Candidatus Hydrogenedentes bacterium]|nr:trypsin-like peptidase domain-containing protein [Candidatus Hydrogenedentota bacterium]
MYSSVMTRLICLLALGSAIAAWSDNTLLIPDPCDKPCITEISTVPWSAPTAGMRAKVVYGNDDRIDVFQETSGLRQRWAATTCALINVNRMTQNVDNSWTLSSPAEYLRWGKPACDGEPFGDQPTAAFCTGFMVGEDLIVTAGHCYSTSSLANVRFVFGYWMLDATTPRLDFLESEVYQGIEVVSYSPSGEYDHSVVRVDRPITVPDAQAFVVRREGSIQPGEYVGVIGHPSGLPMKLAFGDTYVRSSGADGYFVANLDTYGGNSGSPVINATTGMLEGILVRGATDFILNDTDDCFLSNAYANDTGRGEDVTKATVFSAYIPGAGGYAGALTLDHDYYYCNDTLEIEVIDLDLEDQDSTTVILETAYDDIETVILPETSPQSGEFRASFPVHIGPPNGESGVLDVRHDDVITASYLDAVSETGLPETYTVTAGVDCRAPQILSMNISYVSGTQAQLQVSTDEECILTVYLGSSCGEFSSEYRTSWDTEHVVVLGVLSPDTKYYFALSVSDRTANNTYDDNEGACYSFYTYSRLRYFTESFTDSNPVDLAYTQLTLSPIPYTDQYEGCVRKTSVLPLASSDGLLTLDDDAFVEIPFTHGAPISFYGTAYDRMYIGSNGYITFGSGDDTYQPMHSLHFQLPRISGLMCDLNLSRSGAAYCTRVSDRYVVTFMRVPVYSSTGEYPPENNHTFQIELFFDGTVRITWLNLFAANAVVGLSAGLGVPPDYLSENLDDLTDCNAMVFDGECHSADSDEDWHISFNELLRVVQLYNVGEYHCDSESPDGYDTGSGTRECPAHKSDYAPVDWKVDLSELLRLIQLYNAGGYRPHDSSEDGYRPIS